MATQTSHSHLPTDPRPTTAALPLALSRLLATSLGVFALSACTDAALQNQSVRPPDDTAEDTNEVTGDTDTTDIPDVSCSSDEVCRDLITGITACEQAICNPASARCEVQPKLDCCLTDDQCPSLGDPCLQNRCPVAGGSCVALDTCAPCTFDTDCDAQAPSCTSGRCSEGLCIFAPLPTCCIDASDCDDADICTTATCDNGLCLHRDAPVGTVNDCCQTPPVVQTSFSPAPAFEATSSAADAGWYVRESNFTPSPPSALYLGNFNSPLNVSDSGAYKADARFAIGATRPGAIEVKFQIYLDIRDTPEVDRFRVTLSSASGAERLVFSKSVATFGAWQPVKRSVLVDDTGPWTLVFSFEGVTADPERRVGILLDDLQVRTSCGGELCSDDRECLSDDPCVLGRCAGGECEFAPNPNCAECQVDDQCEDGSACTDNRCLEGRCNTFPIPGCCSSDDQCNDGDTCTIDRCRPGAGLCFYERDPNCNVCVPADCNDRDPCTIDICTPDGCFNERVDGLPGCGCNIDRDCDDRDRCTRDACENGVCRNTIDPNLEGCSAQCQTDEQCPPPTGCSQSFCDIAVGLCVTRTLPDCCTSITDCNDGRICTEDLCTADGRCFHPVRPGCCESNAACNDNNVCTADRCNLATGACAFEQLADCCGANGQCNDNNTCTNDACVDGRCVFTPTPNCCTTNAQCNDNNACTADACTNNQCVSTPTPNCCTTDNQCNDNNACTRDACTNNQCTRTPIPDCCTTNAQCNDNNACTADACTNNRCTSTPTPNCCTASNQCNDNNSCTTDACTNGQCTFTPTPNCCSANDQCNDNNSCTTDACTNGQCTFTPGPNCCTADSQCNDALACTTDTCVNGQCVITSIPGCCNANSQCRDNNPCTSDTCFVGRCLLEPLPGCCLGNDQCNDNNACTADACTNNACTSTPIAGCCSSDTQCNDNDSCTNDACVGNRCTFTPNNNPGCQPNGCTADAQCEDGALCTANQCVAGQCRSLPILGCCQSAADCNDNNVCTNDFCFAGAGVCFNSARTCNDNNDCTLDTCDPLNGCVFTPDPACVCQEEDLWVRSFVADETPDIETDGSGSGIVWRVDSVLAVSPTQALRYGNANGSDYFSGNRTFGRATGPSLEVDPAARSVRLDFMVFVDIDRTPDSFRARAVYGNQNVIVWDHVELDPDLYGQWVPVSVALPAGVIGQDVRIRFVFDSVDGTGNLGQGVAVDDIVVYTTCQ